MSRFGLFSIAGLNYAVPLPRLLRIDQQARCFRLPKLPQGVAFILVDGARLIPLLSLQQFSGTGAGNSAAEYVVLVESEYGTVALPADETRGIVAEQKGQIRYLAESDAAAKAGEFNYRQNTFILLDIDYLTKSLTQALH